jgi:hypothetical protein
MIKDVLNEQPLVFNYTQRTKIINEIGKNRGHKRPCLKKAEIRQAVEAAVLSTIDC